MREHGTTNLQTETMTGQERFERQARNPKFHEQLMTTTMGIQINCASFHGALPNHETETRQEQLDIVHSRWFQGNRNVLQRSGKKGERLKERLEKRLEKRRDT